MHHKVALVATLLHTLGSVARHSQGLCEQCCPPPLPEANQVIQAVAARGDFVGLECSANHAVEVFDVLGGMAFGIVGFAGNNILNQLRMFDDVLM